MVSQKSENGTRFYTESDIIRLLGFKRFQLIDFTVQDVADHFRNGTMDTLLNQVEDARDRLKRESEKLLLRAQAVERFEYILRLAQQYMDQMTCVTRPDLYMHACTLAELERLEGRQREVFDLFMNAMPDAHICFLYDKADVQPLKFYFTMTEDSARSWNLPREDMLHMSGGPCVRLFVRADTKLWQEDYLDQQIARVKEAGYQVDGEMPVVVQHLVSEKVGKRGCLIVAIYVSIVLEEANPRA